MPSGSIEQHIAQLNNTRTALIYEYKSGDFSIGVGIKFIGAAIEALGGTVRLIHGFDTPKEDKRHAG